MVLRQATKLETLARRLVNFCSDDQAAVVSPYHSFGRVKPYGLWVPKLDKECVVCYSEFDGNMHMPWACQVCHHYICATCFDTLMREACENNKVDEFGNVAFECPICKDSCNFPLEVTDDKTNLRNRFRDFDILPIDRSAYEERGGV